MAVTKIWAIKDNLQRVLDYAANPDKTEYDALAQTLHYAENDAKTKLNESAQLVTGIHCRANHAWEDMRAVQERFGKTDGVVALHAYQSFREGEVTPEQCHEIGVALARKVWGKRFQVLVATHMNTDNLHNHFVINSVSYVDGKKYEQRRSQYAEFRAASDKLCREYGLSIVEQPKVKEPARYARIREAIDQACEDASTAEDFHRALYRQGYIFGSDPNRKYATIRARDGGRAVRIDLITSNPVDKVDRPKPQAFMASYYSAEEMEKLFEAAQGHKLELIIQLAAFYGLRRAEVMGLRWEAIDFEAKTLTIRHIVTSTRIDGKKILVEADRAKTKSSLRTLPLVDPIAERLKAVKEQQEYNQKICGNCYNQEYLGYVFVDAMGNLIQPDSVTTGFPQLLKENGLRRIRFHDLRHSCASLLLKEGVPMKQIQEWLGHSDISTTANIYAHLDSQSKNLSARTMANTLTLPKAPSVKEW